MAMNDETIKLVLDLANSSKDVSELASKLSELKASAKSVSDTYEVLAVSGQGYEMAESRVTYAMDKTTAKAVELAQAQRAVNRVLDELAEQKADAAANVLKRLEDANDKVGKATKKAGEGTAGFGRTAMETGRIVQDFAQGGLGGILNNLEGFTRAIGLGAGAAGAATILGVAIWGLGPPIRDFIKALADGSNDIPKSTDALKRLNTELGTAKKRLDELSGQQFLTNTELAEYNKLVDRTAKLEKAANDERERRSILDAMRQEEQAGNRESGEIARAAIAEAGGVDAVVEDLTAVFNEGTTNDLKRKQAALVAKLAEAEDAGNQAGVDYYSYEARDIDRQIAEARKRDRTHVEGLVTGAADGQVDAIRTLERLMPGSAMGQATPEAIRAQNEEVRAVEEEGRKTHERRKAQRTNAAQERKADELLENQQREWDSGLAKYQDDARRSEAKQQEKAEDDAKKAADREAREAPKRQKQAELDDIKRRTDFETRGQLTEQQLEEAAKSTQKLIGEGLSPKNAHLTTMQSMVEANAALMDRLSQLEGGFFNVASQLDWQAQQNRQRQQTTRTRMSR